MGPASGQVFMLEGWHSLPKQGDSPGIWPPEDLGGGDLGRVLLALAPFGAAHEQLTACVGNRLLPEKNRIGRGRRRADVSAAVAGRVLAVAGGVRSLIAIINSSY